MYELPVGVKYLIHVYEFKSAHMQRKSWSYVETIVECYGRASTRSEKRCSSCGRSMRLYSVFEELTLELG
jgi:hypothetical protein